MRGEWTERIENLLQAGDYRVARVKLLNVTRKHPENWNAWYLLGQCHRVLGNLLEAVDCLERSAKLKPNEPHVFLALGIANQLLERWDDAVESFRLALEIDPDFYLAINSLAMTQGLRGELDKAAHNYDFALKTLVRGLVMGLENSPTNERWPFPQFYCGLWFEHATDASLFRAVKEGAGRYTWMTGDSAAVEEREQAYEGLYWQDSPMSNGKFSRLYLPNFFNTLHARLRRHPAYALLLRNCGNALSRVGRLEEAAKHLEQAEELSP